MLVVASDIALTVSENSTAVSEGAGAWTLGSPCGFFMGHVEVVELPHMHVATL